MHYSVHCMLDTFLLLLVIMKHIAVNYYEHILIYVCKEDLSMYVGQFL